MNGKMIVTLVVLLLSAAITAVGVLLTDYSQQVPVEIQSENSEEPPQKDNSEDEHESIQKEGQEQDKEESKVDLTDTWELLLANPDNPLPSDFTVETAVVQGNFKMDARVADAMKQMIVDAKADGVDLMICSAYRSIQRQQELFDAEVAVQMSYGKSKEEAERITATMIAVPGTSEHHTGLAADIVTPTHQTLDPAFATTSAGKWLLSHAAEYGFILRYPEDKQDITKIIYESWHYRYVGVEHAAAIKEANLCLEEYLEQLRGE